MGQKLIIIEIMRKIMVAAAAVLLLGSCSEEMPVGSEVESTLYMLSPGEAEFTVSEDNTVYTLSVCKGGYDGRSYKVGLLADEEDLVRYIAMTKETYIMLPGNSYEFEPAEAEIVGDDIKALFRIVFDPACITPGITFLLPLRLVSDDNEAIVDDMAVQYLFVKRNN